MERIDNFEEKISKIYFLSAIPILCSLIQWCLLVNLKSFEFLLNSWLLLGAYITFMVIITNILLMDCTGKSLPAGLEWIFDILLVEILVIVLSVTVYHVDRFVLYISLTFIVMCLVLILTLGTKINLTFLPIVVITVFILNILLMILILAVIIIAKFFVDLYPEAFLAIVSITYPILIINILYVSMLITHDRYEVKSLTDCLRPALYIYGIFGALVWLSLTFTTVINKLVKD